MEEKKELTPARVLEHLKDVKDPEIGISIVELGLIYDVKIIPLEEEEGYKLKIRYTLTTPMCPIGPFLEEEIRQKALSIEGVKDVELELTFDPPWDPRVHASEEVKMDLGIF